MTMKGIAMTWAALAVGVSAAAGSPLCIREFGAATNAAPKANAAAIQKAIDAAAKVAGGGRVVVPPGEWVAGTLWLKSGVELHLEKGAVLKASPDFKDYNAEDAYPENFGCPKSEYWRGLHFIICRGAENVAITGEGTIHGNGDAFFDEKPIRYFDWMSPKSTCWWNGIRWAKDKVNLRPGQLVVFVKCRHLRIAGITIRNSPCWSMFFHGCRDVAVRNYTVRNGHDDGNADGIDIDCCQNVLLEDLDIDTGDDAVAIRGSGARLGLDPEPPCENIVVRRARLKSTSSVFRIGVGAGLIRNVTVEDVVSERGGTAINLNACYGDPKKSGVDMENIVFRRCRFENCRESYHIWAAGKKQAFGIRNVVFEEVSFPPNVPCCCGAAAGSPQPANLRLTNARTGASGRGAEDLLAFERRVLAADERPPELRMNGLEKYSTNCLDFALNNGLAMTRRGRIWASWISGGDGPKSFTAASWSDDGGETWTDTRMVIDGHDGTATERTNIIGTFWLDPTGKLRCYTDQSVLHFDGRAGVWESVCENPDDAHPVWSKARRIGNGHVMNKPIVLANGDWAMPAYLNGTWRSKGSSWVGAFRALDRERGATCFVSSDRGATWEQRGTVRFPAEKRGDDLVEDWQEAQLVELKDGTLRMFARVVDGCVGCLMAADSKDGGRTFSAARRLGSMDNTNARFQIQRLRSGRLIFVKHGVPDAFSMAGRGRRQLTAYLSEDDGKTWKGGLVLDWEGGSYPDLFQAPDGLIYVSHDHGRSTTAEIWLHRFEECDVLAHRIVSARGRLNGLVMRAMNSKHNRRDRRW